jgi:MFS family permease
VIIVTDKLIHPVVLALILVLELTSKRNRGLFVGLLNAGFTTGVSLGAVFFGALITTTSWVRHIDRQTQKFLAKICGSEDTVLGTSASRSVGWFGGLLQPSPIFPVWRRREGGAAPNNQAEANRLCWRSTARKS